MNVDKNLVDECPTEKLVSTRLKLYTCYIIFVNFLVEKLSWLAFEQGTYLSGKTVKKYRHVIVKTKQTYSCTKHAKRQYALYVLGYADVKYIQQKAKYLHLFVLSC